MALQRRLAFFFLTVSSLLCIYILCMSLEVQVPWRMQDPASLRCAADTPSPSSRSRTSEEPLQRSKGDLSNDGPASLGTTLAAATTTTATTAGTLDFAADGSQPPGGKNPTPLVNVIDPSPESYAKDEVRTNEGLANVPPTHAAKTTEPPYIGDTYSSEDIPPQSACTDAISKKLSTTDFSGRFLRTIPVLQWAKHITPKEYERLKQYPGAHGWGGIDYQTLVATLSVLNLPANREMFDGREHMQNGSRCIRCAVVGNGGILKDSQKGKEIDGHDYVFRTNGAIIQGFEMDVGSRTTHYCFSTNTLRNSMRSYAGLGYRGPPVSKETRYIFLPDHDRDYLLMKAVATHTPVERGPERSNSPPNYFGENASAETLKMYHPDFIRYIRNRFLRSRTLKTKYKDIYRPSTGAVMLLAAVHTCDQVSAYGFMTSDYSKYSDHYYDNQYRPVGFYVNHDLRMELELWQQLHHAGLLRLYMR